MLHNKNVIIYGLFKTLQEHPKEHDLRQKKKVVAHAAIWTSLIPFLYNFLLRNCWIIVESESEVRESEEPVEQTAFTLVPQWQT